ncbi:C2 domain-containing protein 5 [Oratosquilla oratoria]|uniref:C2 domain-containing protein 5 n=1 Tax=Oratosquilla oratoria TaxID=337810 RepID=UPI003F76043F
MPGKVKVRVVAGRNLPVMDRSSDTTDAYVEVKVGTTTYKTDVYRKSLNPQWNSEWFRFEVDDSELQDEPLQIRLMDHDTYSANDAIGKVYVDLNPLLLPPAPTQQPQRHPHDPAQQTSTSGGAMMMGWLPVFDTMHGIRGEVNIVVKVDLFSDFNKFRQSSCGVQFFFTPEIPAGHQCQNILGFVEELVVNDDPEYQWIDKIRTPRASNEAKQTLFFKLSGELQRRIGLKVLELGGNAVIGYRQCFDLEGESGIVVRGMGSAVTLMRLHQDAPSPLREGGLHRDLEALVEPRGSSGSGNLTGGVMGVVGSPKRSCRSRHTSGTCHPVSRSPVPSVEPDTPRTPATPAAAIMEAGGVGTVSGQATSTSTGLASGATHSPTHSGKLSSPARTPGVAIHRRSSDSDLSITPKGGGSLAGSGGSSGGGGGGGVVGGRGTFSGGQRPFLTQDSFEMLEYPFLTMKSFPPGFVLHLGGTVSARSVKVLDRIHNPEEPETRDTWWTELRMEMRSHARALCCNVVLGYEEFTTICDEICILNAMGTAAVISLHYHDSSDASLGLGANVMPATGGTMAGGVAGVNRNLKDPMTLSLDRKDFEQQQAQQQQLQHKPSSSYKENISGPQSVMSRSQPGTSEEGGGGSSGEGTSGPTSVTVAGGHVATVPPSCGLCHVPYSDTSLPFRVKISKCNICRRGKVPDVLFTTLEPPSSLAVTGRGTMIQARVAKVKKDLKGELNAKDISDSLPFLEYELHRQLMNKLKVKGMNALFGLRVRVTVGEKMLVGVATATAVFLSALPPPNALRVHAASSGYDDEKKRLEVQRLLQEAMITNKEMYGVKINSSNTDGLDELNCSKGSDTDDSEDDMPDMDLSSGNKDTYVLELDDTEDAEMISVLLEPRPPNYVEVVSTELPPGVPPDQIVAGLQMFTRVWRSKILPNVSHTTFNQYFDRILQSIYFKVRKLSPCVLAGIKIDVELPEEDEVQISILGMVLGQGAPTPSIPHTCNAVQHICPPQHNSQGGSGDQFKKHKQDEGEMIFKMEEVVHGTEELNGKTKSCSSTVSSTASTASTAVTTAAPLAAASTTTVSTTTTTPTTSTSTAAPVGSLPGVSSWQSLGTTASTLSFPSVASGASLSSSSSARSSLRSRHDAKSSIVYHRSPCERYGVEITPLSYIPGARLDRHLGNLNFFFIRESTSIKESGGLSGFMGSFVTEVLAMVRAHVAALGGNAMIAYFMSECGLHHTPHKNQGHCLINVGGDVVKVSYGLGNSLEAPVEE